MAKIQHIFLDDGGVLNDNRLRRPQWERLVGEFFAPRLGGSPEKWAEANRDTLDDVFHRYEARIANWDDQSNFSRELQLYDLDWLGSMASLVGVELPANEGDRLALTAESTAYIMPQVKAGMPGAADTVRLLAKDYGIFTASGGASYELHFTLSGMGIVDVFKKLYGPDLINTPKGDPRFYKRIFADAAVEASDCLVTDDKVENLRLARDSGAHVVRVSETGTINDGLITVRSLAELPALLRDGVGLS